MCIRDSLGTALPPISLKVLNNCDQVIVVVEPVPTTLSQSKLLLEELTVLGIGKSRINVVLVNRIRTGIQMTWSQVQDQLGYNISVIFTPAPELAYQASINNKPMIIMQPDSLTSQQFIKLAQNITQTL